MGSGSTSRWSINYPVSTDPTNVPGDIETPMDDIDVLLSPVLSGTLAARPAASSTPIGCFYQVTSVDATNYGQVYLNIGTTGPNGLLWLPLGAVNTSAGPIGSAGLVSTSTPGDRAAQGSSVLASAADHGHAVPPWGPAGDIQPEHRTPLPASTTRTPAVRLGTFGTR
jgi:hypothetical protein